MIDQIADQRGSSPASASPIKPITTRACTDTRVGPTLSELADALRDSGHAVRAEYANTPRREDQQLVGTAIHFFEQTLALSKATKSSHAYIRLYHSTDVLFLEVTQLRPKTFNLASHSTDAQHSIDELSRWAARNDHALSVRRGPRGQLKIALMVTSIGQ